MSLQTVGKKSGLEKKFKKAGLENRKSSLSLLSPLWNITWMNGNDPCKIVNRFEKRLIYYWVIELI